MNRGYTSVELISVLGAFTVIYFGLIISVSNSFNISFEDDLYDQKISNIEHMAAVYGDLKQDIFSESKDVYMTIADLANLNVIVSGDDGVVVDPRDDEKNLNDLKVKISKENDKVVAKVLS